MRKLLLILPVVLGTVFSQPLIADPVAAQWQAHQVKFRFSGFTSYYTCDGISSAIKRLLLAAGARDDIRVEGSCIDHMKPQLFHRLLIAFAIPVPAGEADITQEKFSAEWRDVHFTRNNPRYIDAGDCELVEQFSKQILPLLNARSVENRMSCLPRRVSLNGINLHMTLLMSLENEQQVITED